MGAARAAARLTAVGVALALAGCGAPAGGVLDGGGLGGGVPGGAPETARHDTASPAPLTGFAARFVGSVHEPAPEATVRPTPGSWDDVVVPAGYTMVVIASGGGRTTEVLTAAVERYAAAHGAEVTVLTAHGDDEVEQRIDEAVAAEPDLVVGVGDGVVDVFSLITAQYLDTGFLVVGAQLPEPTHNVTAVTWPGAEFRGTGLGNDDADPGAVTRERAEQAVGAGLASVLHDLTGIVLDLG